MARRPQITHFPFAERAAEVEAAHKLVLATFEEKRRLGSEMAERRWHAASRQYNAALENAYPAGFADAMRDLKRGDTFGLDLAIEFLEADPMFFRSGYMREDVLRYVGRVPRTEVQNERLRRAVLQIVDRRDGRDFRRFCALARHLDNDWLRSELARRIEGASLPIRRRARWMLAAMNQRL
jgi:hypothetical protein